MHSQALPDLPNGTFDLEQLELSIREAHGSRYHPRPELICLENTHSSAGGRALPLAYLRQVREMVLAQSCLAWAAGPCTMALQEHWSSEHGSWWH